ncbi:MAG: ABC transporter substrate-binding protein [Chloroflexi bacterium]|nr:ABC transporter substrate-binding protein [Chloroflexota bacterium]
MENKKITRRAFLFASAASAAGIVLSACSSNAPTQAPAAKPTNTKAAASGADPTAIPVADPTATPVPTAAIAHEAPMLVEKVANGELPPLEERLPSNPLTLAPVNTIGKYGGTMRIFSDWLGGQWAECQYGYSPLRWIDDGQGIAPGLMDRWSANEDNTVWTFHMREGIKWSDGAPCTVDDILFWWEDLTVAFDPAQFDGIPDFGHDAAGKLTQFVKVDDYTLELRTSVPAPLTAKRLAMWVKGINGPRFIAPKHYLQQFHPKYNPEMKDFSTLQEKIWFPNQPETPTLNPWMTKSYTPAEKIVWERNPYYYAVDTEGNQLPYIDYVEELEILEKEVKVLNMLQGSIDFTNFPGIAMSDFATIKEGEQSGNYRLELLDSGSGTGQLYYWNYDYPDPKIRELYRNKKFRQAMSHALDRPTIQKIVYYGTGILTTGTFSPKAFEFNFNEEAQAFYKKAREIYVEYNPDKAKALLDEIGCTVGADGWRTFPDGSPLEVRIDLQAEAGTECLAVLEIAKKNWEDVGLKIVVNTMPTTSFDPMWHAGQGSIHTNWEWADGPDFLVYPDPGTPVTSERWAPLCGKMTWYWDTDQEFAEADKSPWDRTPPRFNRNDPEYTETPIVKLHELYSKAIVEPDEIKRTQLCYDLWQVHLDEGPFFLGTVANQPAPIYISNKLENVPTREQYKLGGWVFPWILPNCAMTNPETYSFK